MRFVSIIGDSISTYEGFVPDGYSVFYDYDMQKRNGLNSVYDTWWAKVNQSLRAYLCVNNSYSGSKVTGYDFPAASSQKRTGALHTSRYFPDIILVYIGFNDFANGVPIYKEEIDQFLKKDMGYFIDAYSHMLSELKRNYPKAKIVCATLARSAIVHNNSWVFPGCYAGKNFEDYNQAIRQICRKEKCYLADIGLMNVYYETLDGSHPTKNGHNTLYEAWVKCLSELGFLCTSK